MNRVGAQNFILKYIDKLMPGSPNKQLYVDLFASMDDAQFDEWMGKLDRGEIHLAVVAPNLSKYKLTVENNLKIAEELGHNFFERIWIDNGDDIPAYLSPQRYMVIDIPLKRQAQLLIKKISIPEDSKTVDDFTGQPTGKSKGSKLSYPEVQVLAALNLDQNLTEMMKYRGGDEKGFDAMNRSISRTGGVNMKMIESMGTTTKSTETLNIFLTSMHIASTLMTKKLPTGMKVNYV